MVVITKVLRNGKNVEDINCVLFKLKKAVVLNNIKI